MGKTLCNSPNSFICGVAAEGGFSFHSIFIPSVKELA